MTKQSQIIIIAVVCSVVVVGLALGLGLGLGLKRDSGNCPHVDTFVRTTKATCTENGSVDTICEKCGKTLKSEAIAALGHDYGDWKTVVNPTEKTAGSAKRICKNDGAHVETRSVPKLDAATYTLQTVNATCATSGVDVYTSSQYGTFTVVTQKLTHNYEHPVLKTDNSGESPCNMLYCPTCDTKIASLNLRYELSEDGTYYKLLGRDVSSYNDGNLVIPAYYDDGVHGLKPVKEIGDNAFNSVWWLQSVTIPETITTFGAGAFNMGECEYIDEHGNTAPASILSKVYFNAISCDDFNGRNWVFISSEHASAFELIVGAEVERIPANMFRPHSQNPDFITHFNKLTFAENSSLKEIGAYAFYKTQLEELSLPNTVETIGAYAFYGTQLESVLLNDCLTTLGNSAFAACHNLETVTFGAGLKTIGNDCFNYCKELTSADMSQSLVESVGVDAFKNCESLTTAKLAGTTKTLGDSAFENCVALTSCDLGTSLTTLGSRAFYGCGNLTSVTLPAALKALGNSAFENCVKLALIEFNAENCSDLAAGNRAFANAGKQAELTVVVGASVERLPSRLFYSSAEASANVTISQLHLDWNLEKVGRSAFLGVTINKAYFNSDATSWKSVQIESGNDALVNAFAHLTEVAK